MPTTHELEAPIRLPVRYRSTGELLGELTRILAAGRVALASKSFAPVGTRFVLELAAGEAPEKLEVDAEVVDVCASSLCEFQLGVRYAPQLRDRASLDALLRQNSEVQKRRRHPRLPLNLTARSHSDEPAAFLIRDISRGGLRIEALRAVPLTVEIGAPILFELDFPGKPLQLQGEVVWVMENAVANAQSSTQFGVEFGKLRADALARLEGILSLRVLPMAPWWARLSIGHEAVSRMPGCAA